MKKRYWLRGGIIFGCLSCLMVLVLMPFMTPQHLSEKINQFGSGSVFLNIGLMFLSIFIFYFFFGAIIGWIYGKLKNQKSKV